ncbi:nitrate/nitrite two-component system sensor histidine kinase NarQ [Enterobacterales bacterium CwR94]|nr:nitrate/nitrite two-component system sensor histidine kinase NarQ [Enterobacterales bacterium CwR94]
MTLKRSVSTSIARALVGIVMLAVTACGLALLTLSGSLRDGAAINVAGSLRMQSYRLAVDIHQNHVDLVPHIADYRASLMSPDLSQLDRWWVPPAVREQYHALVDHWPQLENLLTRGQTAEYLQQYPQWVRQIEHFVQLLQRYTELKMAVAAGLSLAGLLAIVALCVWTIRLARREVVAPLGKLIVASRHIERGQFHYPPLDVALPNELGELSQTFRSMAHQLERHYQQLEQNVAEKTADLTRANRRLETLYACSQILTTQRLSSASLTTLLSLVQEREQLVCLQLQVDAHWQLQQGEPQAALRWYQRPLPLESGEACLRWQAATALPAEPLMESIAQMLARALWLNQSEKQHQQLLLMEERATIARELHDSLAQSLSFLRIQMTRLKHTMLSDSTQAPAIIAEVENGLTDAYRQLRELLNTFRLTIEQADLTAALQELLAGLRQQTAVPLLLDCQLGSQQLDAPQQVHVLQIVREAVLNAMRHAQAASIAVCCAHTADGDNLIEIRDNGIGIASTEEPEGHYGLTIMQERAQRLNGVLQITRQPAGGTCISLRFPAAPTPTH